MATSDFKAALDQQQTRGITKIDPMTLPGFGGSSAQDSFDPKKFQVRYYKVDFDDQGSISVLEELETRAIRNDGIYILSKDRMSFMDKCFLIVGYLEAVTPPKAKEPALPKEVKV